MPGAIRRVATAALAAAALGLTACTGAPAPTPTPSATPTPTGDGVLRIGTLLPSSGGLAFLGAAQVAGVNAAVRQINAAGGVGGAPVEVISRDSGDGTTDKAETSFADLVAKGADVVVGPSSSVIAARVLPLAAAANVPLVSPAATYPDLTGGDAAAWFFRTIPAYPAQAATLAERLADGGAATVALVVGTDPLTGTLVEPLTAALADAGVELVATVEVAADADAAAQQSAVAEVDDADPDAVVVATADSGAVTQALIAQLAAAGLGGEKLWLTSQNVADYSQALAPGLLTGAHGVLEGAVPDAAFTALVRQEDPGVGAVRYAAEAFDAVVLAALAADLAGDDGGASIARMLREASTGGIKCTSHGECVDVLTTQDDIDYDGVSGNVNLDDAGDLTTARYEVLVYDAENRYASAG